MNSTKYGNLIKIVSMLLVLLLLFNGSWSGIDISGSSAVTNSKTLKVYLRAFVPGDDTPFKSIGHYDLMIQGKVKFRGKTFTNPVFSYRLEDSRLDVFNEGATGSVYAHNRGDYYYDCDVYQWHIETISSATLASFLNGLNGIIASSSQHPDTYYGVKCRIKSSNAFSKYRASSTNCFTAVALWLKAMGDNSLINFGYAVKNGVYPDYFPTTLVKVCSSKFTRVR